MGAYLTQPVTDKVSEDKAFKGMTYGASSMQGWRITQEDAHNCLTDFDELSDTSLFAVYDGHGGSEVAQYCALYLPKFMKKLPEYEKGDLAECSKAAFLKFDATLVDEEVIKELKVLAGDDDGGDEDESSATPCVRSEAEMLRAEANMPLDELLSKYDNLPPGLPTRNLRKSENIASPMIRAKTGLSSNTVGGSSDCVSSSDSNNSNIAISLDSKLLTNGHADNENNLNKEKEIQDSLSCTSENDSKVKEDKDCEPSSSTDKFKSTKNESDSKCSLKESSEANCKTSEADLSSLTISSSSVGSSSSKPSTTGVSCSSSSDSGITSSKDLPQSSSSSSNSHSDVGSSSSGSSVAGSSSAVGSSSSGSSCSVDNGLPGSSSGGGSSAAGGSGSSSDAGASGSGSGTSNEKKSVINIEFGDDDDDDDSEDDEDEYADMESDEDDEEEDDDEEEEVGEDEENVEHPYMDMTNEEPGSDSGCTACLALLRGKQLLVANAGDSRCVLSRDGQAVELSFDHKPEDEIEKNRIEKAGGKVTADGRVNGGLNLSRALGDHWYKRNTDLPAEEQMISASPDIQTVNIEDNDEFIVLACDGIWNYLSSQEVVEYVRERLKSEEKRQKPSLICEELFDYCLAPNTFGDGTGCDNMTCIIIVLNPNKEPIITRKRSTEDIDTSQSDEVQLSKKLKVDEEETKETETGSEESKDSVSSVNK